MAINEMYDFIVWLKNQGQGGYHSPEEIVRALNSGQMDKFNEERKIFEATQAISSDLRNFKVDATVALTSGVGDIPESYSYLTNASTTGGFLVEVILDSEWFSRINDPVAVPTVTRPVCNIRETVQVRPITLSNIQLFYLRWPADMVMNYTEDSEGNITYDSTGSVDCPWPVECHLDIVRRACKYLGIPLRDDLLIKLESFAKTTENQ